LPPRTRGQRRGDDTAEQIRLAGIRLFAKSGYQATTTRDIAAEVGIKVSSAYNHFASKEELLFVIMRGVMVDLVDAIERVAVAHADPVERMRMMVSRQVRFHAERAEEVFIGNSELRSLDGARLAAIIELRDRLSALFEKAVADGVRSSQFHAPDVKMTTFAIVAVGIHVATWYAPNRRLSVEQIAAAFADFVLRGLTNPDEQVRMPPAAVTTSSR
jgi:AcrR family transcriptional regulator